MGGNIGRPITTSHKSSHGMGVSGPTLAGLEKRKTLPTNSAGRRKMMHTRQRVRGARLTLESMADTMLQSIDNWEAISTMALHILGQKEADERAEQGRQN